MSRSLSQKVLHLNLHCCLKEDHGLNGVEKKAQVPGYTSQQFKGLLHSQVAGEKGPLTAF